MKALEMIRSLPSEYFQEKTNPPKAVKKNDLSPDKQVIESFTMISNKQEGVELVKLRNKLFEQQQGPKEVATEGLSDSCVLCFDEKPSLDECVLIRTCGHRICTDCMRDYVDSRLTNALRNAGRLPCPRCDREIELALMVSYASKGTLLETFSRVSTERVLFKLESYKWCPSPGVRVFLKWTRKATRLEWQAVDVDLRLDFELF